jgi:hypothetical protein
MTSPAKRGAETSETSEASTKRVPKRTSFADKAATSVPGFARGTVRQYRVKLLGLNRSHSLASAWEQLTARIMLACAVFSGFDLNHISRPCVLS